ncbi:MAG: hypothetical protein LBL17_03935 [Coxiellaceae bacterium]|nr:hypothetical protein [Coxiellaceae bacterium]
MPNSKKYIDRRFWIIMQYTCAAYIIVLSVITFLLMKYNFPKEIFINYYIPVWASGGCCVITTAMGILMYKFGYFVCEIENLSVPIQETPYNEGIKILLTSIIGLALVCIFFLLI